MLMTLQTWVRYHRPKNAKSTRSSASLPRITTRLSSPSYTVNVQGWRELQMLISNCLHPRHDLHRHVFKRVALCRWRLLQIKELWILQQLHVHGSMLGTCHLHVQSYGHNSKHSGRPRLKQHERRFQHIRGGHLPKRHAATWSNSLHRHSCLGNLATNDPWKLFPSPLVSKLMREPWMHSGVRSRKLPAESQQCIYRDGRMASQGIPWLWWHSMKSK